MAEKREEEVQKLVDAIIPEGSGRICPLQIDILRALQTLLLNKPEEKAKVAKLVAKKIHGMYPKASEEYLQKLCKAIEDFAKTELIPNGPLPAGERTEQEPAPEAADETPGFSRYLKEILAGSERNNILKKLAGANGRLWIDKKNAQGKTVRIWLSLDLTPEDMAKQKEELHNTIEEKLKAMSLKARIDDPAKGQSWKERWTSKKNALTNSVQQLKNKVGAKSDTTATIEEIVTKLSITDDDQKKKFTVLLQQYLARPDGKTDIWTHVRNAYWHSEPWEADIAKVSRALGATFTIPTYEKARVKTWEKMDARASALLAPTGQYVVRIQGKDAAEYPLTDRKEKDGKTSYNFAGLGWVREDDLRICEKKEKQLDGLWKAVDPATFELMAWRVQTEKPEEPKTPASPPPAPPAPKGPSSSPLTSPKKGPPAAPPSNPPPPQAAQPPPTAKGPDVKGPTKTPATKTAVPSAGKTPDAGTEASPESITVSDVPETEAKAIVQSASIRGSAFLGKSLNNHILAEQLLYPRRQVRIGDTTIAFSDPYDIDDGRIAVMAYVQQKGSWVARSFYQSNSQGVWRYLPNYTEDGGIIKWYGKGYSEESISAPIACQKVLAEMSKAGAKILKLKNVNSDVVFAGTARRTGDKNTYLVEVRPISKKLEGNLYPPKGEKIPPENVKLGKKEEAPNFTNLLNTWTQQSNLYDETRVEVFASNDKNLLYMFCSDARGRAWIGGIEDQKSPMTSVGVRQEWIDGGDLMTPAFEYKSQARGFGNAKHQSGNYVDMFENYLSKVPIIQAYIENLKKRGKYRNSISTTSPPARP